MKQDMFLLVANAALDSESANGGRPMEGTIHFDLVRGAARKEG